MRFGAGGRGRGPGKLSSRGCRSVPRRWRGVPASRPRPGATSIPGGFTGDAPDQEIRHPAGDGVAPCSAPTRLEVRRRPAVFVDGCYWHSCPQGQHLLVAPEVVLEPHACDQGIHRACRARIKPAGQRHDLVSEEGLAHEPHASNSAAATGHAHTLRTTVCAGERRLIQRTVRGAPTGEGCVRQ